MSRQRLEGKVALIIGGASGIGEAVARLFAEHGTIVVVADIWDDLGRQVVTSIGAPTKASYVHCDVTDEDQVESAVEHTVRSHGSLDILFSNNAVVTDDFTSIVDLDICSFDQILAVNLTGAAAIIKHAARVMVAANRKKTRTKTKMKGSGSIICTVSVAATVGGAGPAAYTASMHGLLGLVKAASSELGEFGIRVNSVSPLGVAVTPLDCKYMGPPAGVLEAVGSEMGSTMKGAEAALKAKDVAEAALFLASDESAYISGHNLAVDGGYSVVAHSNIGSAPSQVSEIRMVKYESTSNELNRHPFFMCNN